MPTITSATSAFILTVPGVFDSVGLQGYGPDEAFETNTPDITVTQVGVDGTGVAGWVPREIEQTITLLASSPSNAVFDQWIAAMDSIEDVIYASASIRIPALQLQYTMAMGSLRRPSVTPAARRVLMPRQFVITWLPQPFIPAVTVSPM